MMSDGDDRSCQKTMEELGRLPEKILQRIKRCLLLSANCVQFVGGVGVANYPFSSNNVADRERNRRHRSGCRLW